MKPPDFVVFSLLGHLVFVVELELDELYLAAPPSQVFIL